MTNKEAMQSVINMAENLYRKDKPNTILKNDLEITEQQQEALYQMNDYLTDVMED